MPGLQPCAQHGCPTLVPKGYCAAHRADRDRQRPMADVRRLYGTTRWRRLRAAVLAEQPLCGACRHAGRATVATDVDHVVPHRGDTRLFWDHANLQALCHACHSRKTIGGE